MLTAQLYFQNMLSSRFKRHFYLLFLVVFVCATLAKWTSKNQSVEQAAPTKIVTLKTQISVDLADSESAVESPSDNQSRDDSGSDPCDDDDNDDVILGHIVECSPEREISFREFVGAPSTHPPEITVPPPRA